jgi:hypothetical protein
MFLKKGKQKKNEGDTTVHINWDKRLGYDTVSQKQS